MTLNNKSGNIACVTGGSGMVGSRIVAKLRNRGYRVRVMSRKKYANHDGVEIFTGGLDNDDILRRFISDAQFLFHCAAELYDESNMWNVNVIGTRNLIDIINKSKLQYFCYLSSAGVVGRTNQTWVDENTACAPRNLYEKSKLAAEKLVSENIQKRNSVILRPTNIVDQKRPGELRLLLEDSWVNRLKLFLRGAECAHIIHAGDVADAALFFIDYHFNRPQIYFVSCDHETINTFGQLWSLCKKFKKGQSTEKLTPFPHMPVIVPYLLRKLTRSGGNRGDVRYSSAKLIAEGFQFSLGVKGSIKRIISKDYVDAQS
jgi:nucleoside-diphosphate-sugar epimerase